MVQFFCDRIENKVGKEENAGHQNFLLFPLFSKDLFLSVVKTQDCFLKSKTVFFFFSTEIWEPEYIQLPKDVEEELKFEPDMKGKHPSLTLDDKVGNSSNKINFVTNHKILNTSKLKASADNKFKGSE